VASKRKPTTSGIVDKTKQPGISFDKIILVKEAMQRQQVVPKQLTIALNMDMATHKVNESKQWIAELNCKLKLFPPEGGDPAFELECVFVAVFSPLEGEENMPIEFFVESNAAALMFPFVREHVSTITQKAGLRPVLLPPINVAALIQKGKQEKE